MKLVSKYSIFFEENAFDSTICKKLVILSHTQFVKTWFHYPFIDVPACLAPKCAIWLLQCTVSNQFIVYCKILFLFWELYGYGDLDSIHMCVYILYMLFNRGLMEVIGAWCPLPQHVVCTMSSVFVVIYFQLCPWVTQRSVSSKRKRSVAWRHRRSWWTLRCHLKRALTAVWGLRCLHWRCLIPCLAPRCHYCLRWPALRCQAGKTQEDMGTYWCREGVKWSWLIQVLGLKLKYLRYKMSLT